MGSSCLSKQFAFASVESVYSIDGMCPTFCYYSLVPIDHCRGCVGVEIHEGPLRAAGLANAVGPTRWGANWDRSLKGIGGGRGG